MRPLPAFLCGVNPRILLQHLLECDELYTLVSSGFGRIRWSGYPPPVRALCLFGVGADDEQKLASALIIDAVWSAVSARKTFGTPGHAFFKARIAAVARLSLRAQYIVIAFS